MRQKKKKKVQSENNQDFSANNINSKNNIFKILRILTFTFCSLDKNLFLLIKAMNVFSNQKKVSL